MATEPAQIVIGDDVPLGVTLKLNKATFTIDPGADVKARLTSMDHKYTYTDEIACSSGEVGADWPNSLVVVPLTEAVTILITYTGMAICEVKMNDSGGAGKQTFFAEVEIIKGTID
jgi:hypothetical protein